MQGKRVRAVFAVQRAGYFAVSPVRPGSVLSLWSRSGEPEPVSRSRSCPTLPGHQGAQKLSAQFGWYRGM